MNIHYQHQADRKHSFLLPAPCNLGLFKRLFTRKISKLQNRYLLAAFLDLVCMVLIIIHGVQPAKRIISPYVTSLQSMYLTSQIKSVKETFSFIPGLARNKFDSIDLNGLNFLSFFDIPVTEDGSLYQGRGFTSLTSYEAAQLFSKAHFGGTKVLATLSSMDQDAIYQLLNSDEAQNMTISQTIQLIKDTDIDGVTVDFELAGNVSATIRNSFNRFIANLTSWVHFQIPAATVAVVVPSNEGGQGFYDLPSLSKSADRIFITASDFAVLETKDAKPVNPLYGYNEKNYWSTVSNTLNKFIKRVPESKLVLERAWYGSGDKYPLYDPKIQLSDESSHEPAHVLVDQILVERLTVGVPQKGREAARRNIPLIAKALEDEGILDSNVLAYALATIEHETDETFEPIEEIGGSLSARRFGYEGGTNYFGRGFIQLTHLRNYKAMGERIGVGDKLAQNPKLASDPKIAAKILAAFFKDNNIANLASQGRFVAARVPINPDMNGFAVASLASKYEIDQP